MFNALNLIFSEVFEICLFYDAHKCILLWIQATFWHSRIFLQLWVTYLLCQQRIKQGHILKMEQHMIFFNDIHGVDDHGLKHDLPLRSRVVFLDFCKKYHGYDKKSTTEEVSSLRDKTFSQAELPLLTLQSSHLIRCCLISHSSQTSFFSNKSHSFEYFLKVFSNS